jgi:hypothetical protein
MSTPPESQAHLRPSTVEIPRTWTPEEALAVFELIDELRDKICALYLGQLQDLLREQPAGARMRATRPLITDRPEPRALRLPSQIAPGPDQEPSCCSIMTAIPSSRPALPAPSRAAAVNDGRRPPRRGAKRH